MSQFKQDGSPLLAYRMRSAAQEIALVATSIHSHADRNHLAHAAEILRTRAEEISPLPIQRLAVDAPSRGRGASQ